MARPTKTGLDYFPLTTHFDNKVRTIQRKLGVSGIGVLTLLWQHIYARGYVCSWSAEDAETFAYDNHIELSFLQSVVSLCVETGVFDGGLLEREGVLTSSGIQVRFLEATRRRAVSVIDDKYRVSADINRALSAYSDSDMSAESLQSKAEQSIGDNSISDQRTGNSDDATGADGDVSFVDNLWLSSVFGEYSRYTLKQYLRLKEVFSEQDIHWALEKTLALGGKTIAYTKKILEEEKGRET